MPTGLEDLSDDVFSIILSFLAPRDYLSLCRSSHGFYQYRQDPVYWRNLTSSTFRLPISPLLRADGARWYFLYKRLKTQTRLYTWGQGQNGGLGQGRPRQQGHILRTGIGRNPPLVPRGPPLFERISSSWPTESHVPSEIKVIADFQCGGWSSSILSSDGKIYVTGIINAENGIYVGEASNGFKRLEYLTQSTSSIEQFSSGRSHILALTANGEILSWDRIEAKGMKVFPRTGTDFGGRPTRVVAGWGESSAYIPDTGIVFWKPIENTQQDQELDGLHVSTHTIPGTARTSPSSNSEVTEVIAHVVLADFIVWITSNSEVWACNLQVDEQDLTAPILRPFQVPGYGSQDGERKIQDIQGQHNQFAVFTATGEVYAGHTDFIARCAEVAKEQISIDDPSITVPPSSWPDLDQLLSHKPRDVTALQHNQVIKLAFGDHHYHALHANGQVTSYGHEPQSTGALGLGSAVSGSRFRGLYQERGFRADSKFIPKAENRGRHVWFEPEKRDWLSWMEQTLRSGEALNQAANEPNSQHQRPIRLFESDRNKQYMFSEWVEQEGQHWDEGPTDLSSSSSPQLSPSKADNEQKVAKKEQKQSITTVTSEEFYLDAYFTISIAAAGWHSGALVSVDDAKAEETRQKWIMQPAKNPPLEEKPHVDDKEIAEEMETMPMPGLFVQDKETEEEGKKEEEVYVWKNQDFPNVKLPDGSEMPGVGRLRAWRDGMPTLEELNSNF